MIFETQAELCDRIESLAGRRVQAPVQIFEDSSDYMAISGGSVLRLAGADYFVLGDTREGRFGIDDQPKFWVKYGVDLTTGEQKIIKLVYHEHFSTRFGNITVQYRRSPLKESAFLDRVRGNPDFMQGRSVIDAANNLVRIIDFIPGRSLYQYLLGLEMSHERYFHEVLPSVMARLIASIQAMARAHGEGLHHGDVRTDHILIDAESGRYRWIDFDYESNFLDYDIWCMGSVICFAIGKGSPTFHDVAQHPQAYPQLNGRLVRDDALVLQPSRVATLDKLFPYLPAALNRILRRFCAGATSYYDDLESLVADLVEAQIAAPAPASRA